MILHNGLLWPMRAKAVDNLTTETYGALWLVIGRRPPLALLMLVRQPIQFDLTVTVL
jgi:hypothetical protein